VEGALAAGHVHLQFREGVSAGETEIDPAGDLCALCAVRSVHSTVSSFTPSIAIYRPTVEVPSALKQVAAASDFRSALFSRAPPVSL